MGYVKWMLRWRVAHKACKWDGAFLSTRSSLGPNENFKQYEKKTMLWEFFFGQMTFLLQAQCKPRGLLHNTKR
jgi:hypothetical protein